MGLFDRVGRFLDDVLLLPDDVRDTLSLAEEALAAELHAEAERMFLEVLRVRPTLGRAAVGLARARSGLGDHRGALEALAEARETVTLDPEMALWMAGLAMREGRPELAARAARSAARSLAPEGGPRFARACRLLGDAEWSRGRPDRALREYQKALSIGGRESVDEESVRLRVVMIEAAAAAQDGARAASLGDELWRLVDGRADVSGPVAARVGLALSRAGKGESALRWLQRSADSGDAMALVALAEGKLRQGALDEAEHHARSAVARGGGAKALATLADVLVAMRRGVEAAEAVSSAGHASGDPELHRGAVRVADLEDPVTLTRYADALATVAPDDAVERLARAFVALRGGDLETAANLDVADEPRGTILRAEIALAENRPDDALDALDEFSSLARGRPYARIDDRRVEALRRRVLRASWGRDESGAVDLPRAIDAVARFAERQDLDEVMRQARALRDELDRPLLLAVLGEFNAGKSTLINAFIGAEVAPMGIVPTTATLNVLRGGSARRVRLVRVDGSTREGPYASLGELLDDAEAAGEQVDHVEIVLPSEQLDRVWVLDAPGTNALDPTHERLAREAARRADAVLWVFDAAQAGKKTEASFYSAFRDSGRRVIPILNKRDRLKDGELERVLRVVRESWEEGASDPKDAGSEVGEVVTLSAKQALKARLAGDDEALSASGYDALMAHLDAEVFSRAHALKQRACVSRLVAVLSSALETERDAVEREERRVARLNARAGRLRARYEPLRAMASEAARELSASLDEVFGAVADELLATAPPGASTFGRARLDAEEQRFAIELLERRLGAAIERSERRLLAECRGTLAAALGEEEVSEDDGTLATLDLRARAALGPAYASFTGFQRGLMARGAIRRFFGEALPRAATTREGVMSVLAVLRADPRQELGGGLQEAVGDLVAALEADSLDVAREAEARAARLSAEIYAPLRALREVLAEMIREPERAESA